MIAGLRRAWDAFRGSGEAAVTVPPMDGALRPNQLIEEAPERLAISSPDDLAQFGESVVVSSGNTVHKLLPNGQAAILASYDSPVTALAGSAGGALAIALGSGEIHLLDGVHDRLVVASLGGRKPACTTALAFRSEDELIVAQGSASRPVSEWKRDLMERGATGSVWSVDLARASEKRLADNLAWPAGIAPQAEGGIVISESWRHRLLRIEPSGAKATVLGDLPGYPARLHGDPIRGGYWLALFAPRNQIIEFVQREPAFLKRMMEDVDEAFWAAPTLRPSATFLEPLQGGAQKHLGMLKPWAPTRSYGLVARLDEALRPLTSYHSRADGQRHGIMTALPGRSGIMVASKGGDVLVEIQPEPSLIRNANSAQAEFA